MQLKQLVPGRSKQVNMLNSNSLNFDYEIFRILSLVSHIIVVILYLLPISFTSVVTFGNGDSSSSTYSVFIAAINTRAPVAPFVIAGLAVVLFILFCILKKSGVCTVLSLVNTICICIAAVTFPYGKFDNPLSSDSGISWALDRAWGIYPVVAVSLVAFALSAIWFRQSRADKRSVQL